MSLYNTSPKYLDELFFDLLEYYNFETQFTSDLSQNILSTHIICLVDAEEIESWKSANSYNSCLKFLENCDSENFKNFQLNLINQNQTFQKNKKKFKIYQTLDEVCNTLKKGGRIAIIGQQFLCYLNKITYTKKCFKCYSKNNQLIIYFGQGKSIFIPDFFLNKILDSENVYIIDLQGDKTCFIEAVFDNNNRYQNFYESIKSCGNKVQDNLKVSMTNLLSYDINKDELKKCKNYNFYFNEEEKNNDNYENKGIIQQDFNNNNNIYIDNNYENYNLNNNNNLNYDYNNNYYINYEDNGQNQIIEQNIIYSENPNNYFKDNNNNINININEYPRDSNENLNLNINNSFNKKFPNQNYISEEEENKENLDINNNNIENKEKEEKQIYENENQNENNIKVNDNIQVNQTEKEKENNNNEENKKEIEKSSEKEENKSSKFIGEESQNQIDQEKDIFYINYAHNQKLNPELKDLDISTKKNDTNEEDNNNIDINISNNNNINNNIENEDVDEEFVIENIKQFPSLGLINTSGNNSYINASIQCLANTIPLINILLKGKNLSKIISSKEEISPRDNPQLLPSFLKILSKLWTNTNPSLKCINPQEFTQNLKLFKPFENEEESDAGSLITFILEQIHSEIENNDIYKENNINIIDTFFGGEKELVSECLVCLNNNQSQQSQQDEITKFIEKKDLYYLTFKLDDVMEFLESYKIKENNSINIYDCLNYFENPNAVIQNKKICEKCGNKDTFLISSKITKCQNNLMILLNKNFKSDKNNDFIFELNENIDLKRYIQNGENEENNLYYLYNIICLNIKFEEDKNIYHHIAFCKSPVDGKWYKYDDTIVEQVINLENEVNKYGIPVVLFYQKIENYKKD